jgi:ABC-type multidrug transport system ATPase subunit
MLTLSAVHETLTFAAKLRLPEDMTPQQRATRVHAVLRTLGLQGAAGTRVGGELTRGISGGERKRLCLAVDLLLNPPLLFTDEPTSGLDAFNGERPLRCDLDNRLTLILPSLRASAENVVEALHRLAASKRTVVCTVHQPRSGIVKKFDCLLLLSEGRVIYSGLLAGAVPFFDSVGLRLPPSTNPADFFIDAISLSFSSARAEAASRARIAMLADSFSKIQEASLQELWAAAGEQVASAPASAEAGHRRRKAVSFSRWSKEYCALLQRNMRLVSRQSFMITISLVRTAVFGLFLGLIWLRAGRKTTSGSIADIRAVSGLLFFSLVNHSFSGVFGGVCPSDGRAMTTRILTRSDSHLHVRL